MTTTININVVPGKIYKVQVAFGVRVYYSGILVAGPNLVNTFIAIPGVNTMTVETDEPLQSAVRLTESLRSYYSAYDNQGGTWAYKPNIDRWVTQYSFQPEWMGSVGNRLLSFKDGMPYIHNATSYNNFYGRTWDSVLSMVHNDAGADPKVYNSVAIQGSVPDILHVRTEVPDVQSSDLRPTDFVNREGIAYASIMRDRLTPHMTGAYNRRLYRGDTIRGEVGLFQGVFFAPSTNKLLKFVNIGFIPSRGHNTQNS